ncbi:MAG: SUMF1/EgtB/PvdO family nonheme iron enzyme [Kiritimatiellaeota bacterium]|nr:SUMF1/EgtB/PvdO family nonheme iron enzyme [Kiritimatiellota bacterium]
MFVSCACIAGQVTWKGAWEIKGDRGVRTDGKLCYAYAASGAEAAVNGVAFKAFGEGAAVAAKSRDGGSFGSANKTSDAFTTAFRDVVKGAFWQDGEPVTVTLKQLTQGKHYLVQVWVNDSRGLANSRTAVLDGGKTVLSHNKGAEGSAGCYALGVFTADGAEQSFTVKGNISSQVNALQVREIEGVGIDLALAGESRFDPEAERKSLAVVAGVKQVNAEAVERAITFLGQQYPGRYDVKKAQAALAAFRAEEAFLKGISRSSSAEDLAKAEALVGGVRAALLANPLLDADRVVYVRRVVGGNARNMREQGWGAIALNSYIHTAARKNNWKSEIVEISNLRGEMKERVIKSFDGPLIRDLKLTYDAKSIYYTGVDANNRFAVYSLPLAGGEPTTISPTGYPDVEWFDAVQLPDGRYIMLSTASYQGLPCESGSRPMAVLYQVDPAAKTNAVRQLTFEQDSNYTPSVMNDGRVVYTRWEYSDIPHYYSRILMSMNPDGTSQLALWGSGSYFPTTLFQVRSIPGETSKLIGTVSGHHDVAEVGRLIILDPSMGRKVPFKPILTSKAWGPDGTFIRIQTEPMPPERTGLVQEIPGFGQWVETDVCDGQAGNQHDRGRPFFAYPHPLSAEFHLVTAKPKDGLWGIYLVDTFDNITLLRELPDSALLEPLIVQARPVPRTIPDRITPGSKTASVHIADIYQGPGLAGVPRGTVKALRIFSYHFNYMNSGGHESVGYQSGWDIKRILGTVEVEEDGSACFEIPANTPVAVQPLDANGAAVQLMRSWFVGMPGERVSCTGCHEDNRMSLPPTGIALAERRAPQQIKPWHGPSRAMTFTLDVWPQVQQYCVGCHDDKHTRKMTDARKAYESIHPYLRRPGPEGELEMYPPMDWHVSSSLLFQMLWKGHHNVNPSPEFYERLAAWTDMNCPWRGKWDPPEWEKQNQRTRRIELAKEFANIPLDGEAEYDDATALLTNKSIVFIKPEPIKDGADVTTPPVMKVSDFTPATKVIDLGNGEKMTFVRVPAGTFTMGNPSGFPDEKPRGDVTIAKPFWMAATELRNRDYALFDPDHDSRYIAEHGKDHAVPGYIANHPDQPAVRVSWQRAMAYCEWFSKAHNVKATLPTEAQWEWAARAGTTTQFFYGDRDADFSPFANLADKDVANAYTKWEGGSTVHRRHPYPEHLMYPLHDNRFKDNWFVGDYVAQVKPNPWGLFDMVGNVCEWTRSDYLPYPYADTANTLKPDTKKVARGGSWASRPKEAGAAVRYQYEPWQGIVDVGLRLIIED